MSICDLEPALRDLAERKEARLRAMPVRVDRAEGDVLARLNRFLNVVAPATTACKLTRIGGGTSREQFSFEACSSDGTARKLILRMDPLATMVETDRRREFQALNVFRHVVPAPEALWIDSDGDFFGLPAMICDFVPGIALPPPVESATPGFMFEESLRQRLADEFVAHLAKIHAHRVPDPGLSLFAAPAADGVQAALWQVNWCAQIWRSDRVTPAPLLALVNRWLHENLPTTTELVFCHGDYRTGNYLFDEKTGVITAVLDWELGHIGDNHEDLAYTLLQICGSSATGRFLCCGLLPRNEMIERYERASGRTVDPKTLRFYEVLLTYRCAVMVLASALRAANDRLNHQNIVLTWAACHGHSLKGELIRLLDSEL